jgi:hypothetical protein
MLGCPVPAIKTPEGLRATSKGEPCNPASVDHYLAAKFGARLDEVTAAMILLADSMPSVELARRGFRLYADSAGGAERRDGLG